MMNRYGLLISLILLLASCRAKPGTAEANGRIQEDSVGVEAQFPFPEIPAMYTSPDERKAYLLTNYWERFDFADTTLVNNRDVTEQGFVNFIALLADNHTPERMVCESMMNFCAYFLPSAHARRVMARIADDYLYNPNSPFYNEGLYAIYLEAMLAQLPPDDAQRSTCDFRLKLVRRNNPGDRATDFAYYLPDGTRRTLAATRVKNNRLLLMFYDPECESCHEVLQRMAADKTLAEAVAAGRISVLAVYTEGNEAAWRKALPDMPKGWTVGTDREAVKNGALYDLKAMPTLYLLDGAKKVVLKDTDYERIRKELVGGEW